MLKFTVPATSPFRHAIRTASLVDTFRVRLLSMAQQTQAAATSNAKRPEFAVRLWNINPSYRSRRYVPSSRPVRHRRPVGRCARPRTGLPVLHRFPPCMHAIATTTAESRGAYFALFPRWCFPEILAGRLPHCVFRGLLSVHSRYGLHARQVTYMTLYIESFSRFVASTTAPIATGWSASCRAGFAPAETTAHKILH